jgi:4'-phosphopantetheinyl transferase
MIKSWNFDDRVSLYLYSETDDDFLPRDWKALASTDERERAAKMGDEKRAHSFLRTRALLRQKLTETVGGEPAALPIVLSARGKPVLPGVAFSVSHSHGLILIAVLRSEGSVGVDLEKINSTTDMYKVAKRLFSEADRATIAATAWEQQRAKAFQIWCVREARCKLGAAVQREESGVVGDGYAYAVCYNMP